MSTTDTVLLIVLTSILSLFFLLACVAVIFVIKLISSVKKVVEHAESLIDSVEAAAEVFKGAGDKMNVLKLVKNIFELVQRKK
jgi:uncharacterized protein YoxC